MAKKKRGKIFATDITTDSLPYYKKDRLQIENKTKYRQAVHRNNQKNLKHTKECSNLFTIKEMQIKTRARNNFSLLELQKSRNWTAHSVARLRKKHILLLGTKLLLSPITLQFNSIYQN